MVPKLFNKTFLILLSACLGIGGGRTAYAQSPITLDGSTGAGAGANQNFSALPGANQTIILEGGGTNRHGTVNGGNLFFSFNQFGIASGDTAQFQCTGCGNLSNVVSRVTGGTSSVINGTLRSIIPNANFWFFNPNGVVLGANSAIDVPAALHIASGNSLSFGASSFSTDTNPNSSSLTFAQPAAFGFGGSGNISVSGTTITVGSGGVEVAAAQNVDINGQNMLNSPGTITISAGNGTGANSSITMANAAQLNTSTGVALHSLGAIAIADNAMLKGNASADTDLANNGKITGSAQAGNDLNNSNNGIIENGAMAGHDLLNAGAIVGGQVQATRDIINTGAIALNQEGAVQVVAGRDIVNQGNAVSSGSITVNQVSGSATVNAGRNLVLGQGADKGLIQKNTGDGSLTIASGNGSLLINNSGSAIKDKSSGVGGLTVTIPNGDLNLGNGTAIVKTVGTGAFSVDVQAGNIRTSAGASIGKAHNTGQDAITASGNIDNSGQLMAGIVQANGDLVNHVSATITGNAKATGALVNAGEINGNAVAGNTLANSGVVTGNAEATQQLLNNGVINQNATSLQGQLLNNGLIQGNASADTSLINTGKISQNALAKSGVLQNSGEIAGNAEATLASLDNSQTISGAAKAGTDLLNQVTGVINNGAQAGRDLSNKGLINGASIQAGRDLANLGANAQIHLDNSGSDNQLSAGQDLRVDQGAKIIVDGNGNSQIIAGRNLQIGGDGIGTIEKTGNGSGALLVQTTGNGAVLSINNAGSHILDQSTGSGSLEVSAQANNLVMGARTKIEKTAAGKLTINTTNGSSKIDEQALVVGDQSSNGGELYISGSFENKGLLKVKTVHTGLDLTNSGTITGNAIANQHLFNTGVIDGNAQGVSGNLVNSAEIHGFAAAGSNLENQASATIGNGAQAGQDLLNQGLIQAGIVRAGRDLLNTGSNALLKMDGAGNGEVSAGRDLTLADGAKIVTNNAGDFYVLAGRDMLVKGQNTQIIANNLGAKATLAAGAVLNNGLVQTSATGGDLHVSNAAILEKTNGLGDFTIAANKQLGTTSREQSTGGQITIKGSGTAIMASHQGQLQVNAGATASKNSVAKTGQFLTAAPSQYALQVSDGGTIIISNKGGLDVQAQTVFLQGQAIKAQKSDVAFTGRSGLDNGKSRIAQDFKMQGAVISSTGSVAIKNYYLDMQKTSIPSGIKAGTELTLKAPNIGEYDFPEVVVGLKAADKGQRLQLNYLNTPVLNGHVTSTPDVNKVVKAAALAVLAKQIGMPSLPKNPCDSQRLSQSSLNTQSAAVYLPEAIAQLPYSMLAVTAKAPSAKGNTTKPASPILLGEPQAADGCH